MPYKFIPSDKLSFIAEILTSIEVHQMDVGNVDLSELVDYHVQMVAIGIAALCGLEVHACREMYNTVGDNLLDTLIEKIQERTEIKQKTEQKFDDMSAEERTKKEEEFLKGLKEATKWKM